MLGTVLVASAVGAGAGQGDVLDRPPREPLVKGRALFESKGCAQCHATAGAGENRGGPDLGLQHGWRDLMQFAGALWNHAPAMQQKMHDRDIARPSISTDEMADLAAYVFFVKFRSAPGDVDKGRQLFEQRLCVRCHQLGGHGGTVGPRLDELKEYASSFFMAQALWNHGPEMAAKMADMKLTRPVLEGDDVAHLVAFIRGGAGPAGPMELAYAEAGNPDAGQFVFHAKGCVRCHAVAGAGGSVGPDLGKVRAPENVSHIAGAMWNHGPKMWAKMAELGVPVPKLTDRDMADLLAYLYYVQVMGEGGNAESGSRVMAEKSCTQCHALATQGAQQKADVAMTEAARSPLRWAAAMWNHAPAVEGKLRETQTAWPHFDADQMRDVVQYIKTRAPAQERGLSGR